MPKTITLAPEGRKQDGNWVPGKRVVATVSIDGSPVSCDKVAVDSARSRKKLQLDDAVLLPLLLKALATGETLTHEYVEAASVRAGTLRVTVREVEATSGTDHVVTPEEALHLVAKTPVDLILAWTDEEILSCLDVDWHDAASPSRLQLTTWVEMSLTPRPAAWHFSRNTTPADAPPDAPRTGGIHLYYIAAGGFSARELAACAALRFRILDSSAGLELKRQIRGAGKEPTVIQPQRTEGTLSTWLGTGGEVDEEAVTEWLESARMERGQRYDHTMCPIDPTSDPGKNNPVTVSDLGVFCHRCAGKGYVFGSRAPGYASFASLTRTPASTDIGQMLKNLVHWGHAKHVLRHKYDMPEGFAHLAYTAACKAANPGDIRVAAIAHPDTDDLARVGGVWKNIDSAYTYPKDGFTPLIACLPAAQDPDGKPVVSTVSYLSQGHNLSRRGYRDLSVIQGYSLAKQYLPLPPEAMIPVLLPELRGQPFAPKYVRGVTKMQEEAAWGVLEKLVPLVDKDLVRLLLCAAASAQETALGMHPMLFVSGGSGTGKTGTAVFAMGLLGTKPVGVQYHRDDERLKQSIKAATENGGLCLANEFLKDARRMLRINDPEIAFESLLTVTPDTQSHVMYIGARAMGRLPPIVITEPNLPPEISDCHQIGRRTRLVQLCSEKDWVPTFAELGLSVDRAYLFRSKDQKFADAADVILSAVIDRFFSTPRTWDSMAEELGAFCIDKHPNLPDPKPRLREFFRAVCDAPAVTDPQIEKRKPGYKRIPMNDTQTDGERDLSDLYTQFTSRKDWFFCPKLNSDRDWSTLLGCNMPVNCDVSPDNTANQYVRFRVGPMDRPTYLNGNIPCKLLGNL